MVNRLKMAAKLWAILGLYEKIRKEAEMKEAKSLIWSKTFWTNVIMLVLTAADIMPPKYGVPTMAIANVILRLMSNQAVVLGPGK